ncbi:MAG: 1-deoxy-D-xylulose-5-phosphate synthase [Nitrospirae bacterium]|nr:1-deoxy-D-xylulose-5-phosphate synthase [Nitrospirota bacterium]
MNNISQRDAFWNRVYEIARKDTEVVVISADMGAPALDKFRRDMPSQFVNVGIAEQNAITIAAGLRLAGKKVFVYAIAPFITLRCLEQIRVENAIMDIPVTIVGVGAGFGYEDSGPTHHIIEDIAIMRSMPRIQIHSITDSVMASAFADISYHLKTTNYIRLDRQILPDVYHEGSDFTEGLSILRESDDCYIISTGSMTHTALELARDLEGRNINAGVIDVYNIPINGDALAEKVRNVKKLISLEEHFLPGGLGSAVCEVLNDYNIPLRVRRLGLSTDKLYCYKYGGREVIRGYYGVDKGSLAKDIAEYLSVESLCSLG